MPNPFEEAGMTQPRTEWPADKIAGPGADPVEEKENVSALFGSNESSSLTKGNWRTWMVSIARKVGGILLEFVKRAIHLAAAKFILEFCAMVIDSIMRALIKTGHSKMDISSTNVNYAGAGSVSTASAPGAQPGTLFEKFSSTMRNSRDNPPASAFESNRPFGVLGY